MLTTGLNAMALARFGGFRFFHGGGGGDGLLWLFGLVVVGVLVWALTRPERCESANN
ncbi:MAG: hypothetical protein ABSC47_03515 [Terracidiphilus sp.]|jgi:hypothetical protein